MIPQKDVKKLAKTANKLSDRVKVLTDHIEVSCDCGGSKAARVSIAAYMTTVQHSMIRIFDVLSHYQMTHPVTPQKEVEH